MDKSKPIKLVLSSGLFIYGARIKENKFAILYSTDYENNSRIMIDLESKKVLYNKHNVSLSVEDINSILASLKEEIVAEKIAAPIDAAKNEVIF